MLFPHPFEENQPLLPGDTVLTAGLCAQDLPASYRQLLLQQNGGYVQKWIVPTAEPTSDGLDHANLHYLFGLHVIPEHSLLYQQKHSGGVNLPDYFLIFSANGSQLFAFDYSRRSPAGEPSIRYLDLETDNWQTVAPDFTALLKMLEPGKMVIPQEGTLSRFEAEHALLLADTAEELTDLFLHLEVDTEKSWYFRWLELFAQHPNPAFRAAALEELETQVLFFRLQLPANTQRVFEQFLQGNDSDLQKKAQELWQEWQKPGW